jgi:hypothetical protein
MMLSNYIIQNEFILYPFTFTVCDDIMHEPSRVKFGLKESTVESEGLRVWFRVQDWGLGLRGKG